MPDPLLKAISMGGAGVLRVDDHPNDYRLWGNREFHRGEGGCRWTKLWVSWYELQQDYKPTSRADSWNQLNTAPGGKNYLRRLDRQVRAANDDGVKVILCLQQAFPTWSSGATGSDPYSSKTPSQKIPSALGYGSGFGWFISHLSARYNGTSNSVGPRNPDARTSSSFGNPDRALVHAIEVSNEPNALYWPQADIHKRAAEMLRCGEECSYRWGKQRILGPGTLDSPDPPSSRPDVFTDWRTFTEGVLAELASFRPRVPVGFSAHNYRDVKYDALAATSRARQVVDLLYAKNWLGAGGSRSLWLTEGGFNMGSSWQDSSTRRRQAEKIVANYNEMLKVAGVVLWTQHVINDVTGNSFRSGLRDDFVYSPPGPGGKRPSYDAWCGLPVEGNR